jgi:hypothetical protein
LKNILEREFGVKRERVPDALNVFKKSADEAGVLTTSQGKTYLLKNKETIGQSRDEQKSKILQEEVERKGPPQELTDDSLRNMYIQKLIESMPTPNTDGKDAQAIEAEAKMIDAQLSRIERLLAMKPDVGDKK